MRAALLFLMLWMLLRPATAMSAVSAACSLFVRSVLPGLFPYMTLSLMLVSCMPSRMSPRLVTILGWCGGSPTGARLLALCPGLSPRMQLQTAVSCATMSPMFLIGTVGGWLCSPAAGICVLAAVLLGGWLAGLIAGRFGASSAVPEQAKYPSPLSFGEAVTSAASTMLMVCGTMAMLRTLAALVTEVTEAMLPALTLPLTTLLEVTTGTETIAQLPLPLPLRTALIAGATGFGGTAVAMQNRAAYPAGLLSLPAQLLWQALHGAVSFLAALGLMLLIP